MIKNISLSLAGLAVVWFFSVSLPYWIAARGFNPFPLYFGSLRFLGWIPMIMGAFGILWCYWLFIFIGKGTAWHFDPPRKLVVAGLYRLVRNPMEDSALLIVAGEVLLFESSGVFIYLVSSCILLYMRQVFIEEPTLRRRFGQPYEQYCKSVPRYIPGLKPYTRKE